ncbi:hydroxyneurosporene-O-methyltransferase [Pelodictyon luteolum DSM 273]|uniref:Hydroxyneurosporene-O-methyltransferase n=2 Tax=Pelodictyon luteolum TaxID=1100 RepID=Q3B4T7_CHLL3|nr:hydroxyneurosporene-O-methyltransferase [Pelodictyon luteolum DSM 273]
MTMNSSSKTPYEVLREMSGGFMLTQLLYTAVKLRIVDHLHAGIITVPELSAILDADVSALNRFLRMLVVINILVQREDGCFEVSALGELLRHDHPDSLSNRIHYIGEVSYPAAQGISYAVQTGEPGFDHVFGMSFFDYFSHNPHLGTLFNELMRQGVADRVANVVQTYDFSGYGSVVDVGGGNGALAAVLAEAYSDISATVFDAPAVIEEARRYFAEKGLSEQCQVVAGDFFLDPVPNGAHLYVLSNIIHDWDDQKALSVLENCRAAMDSGSVLLIIEQIMPEKALDAPVTVASDVSMLLLLRGRERTEMEYDNLLARAGLRMTKVYPFEQSKVYSGRKSNWAVIESRLQSAV